MVDLLIKPINLTVSVWQGDNIFSVCVGVITDQYRYYY